MVSGKVGCILEGVSGALETGQEVIIKAGMKHTFFNAAPEQSLVIEVAVRPAVSVVQQPSPFTPWPPGIYHEPLTGAYVIFKLEPSPSTQ